MTNKTYKKIFILLAVGAVLAIGGYVAALSGWFGGGAAIPEDTMTRGLVGYWSFDEGGGQTAKDLSGNGNNGTLGATATAGADDPLWTKGKNGGALKFDGKDDYVDAGSATSLDIAGDITISAWVNTNNLSATVYVVSKRSYNLVLSSVEQVRFFTRKADDSDYDTSATGATLVIGTWNHIVGIYNTQTQSLVVYVNGVAGTPVAKTDGAMGDAASRNLIIGNFAAGTGYFSGSIDDVRIYNRALTAEEVRYHYNRGGPVAEWKFDEGSGTTIYDSTENNKDGVLHE